MTVLETPRLRLRAYRRDEAPRLAELLNDPEVSSLMSRVPCPYTLRDAEYWITQVVADHAAGPAHMFTITMLDTDQIIGGIGLTAHETPSAFELGYWIGKDYWGMGFGGEAAQAIANHAFMTLKAASLIAHTVIDHKRSQGILVKAGFYYEGVSDLQRRSNGGDIIGATYRMTHENWLNRTLKS